MPPSQNPGLRITSPLLQTASAKAALADIYERVIGYTETRDYEEAVHRLQADTSPPGIALREVMQDTEDAAALELDFKSDGPHAAALKEKSWELALARTVPELRTHEAWRSRVQPIRASNDNMSVQR